MASPGLASGLARVPSSLRGYSPLQIGIAGLLAVVALLGGLFLLRSVSTPAQGVLYSNLSSKDAAAIAEQLTGQGVPFELAAGGSAITVPVDQVDALRLTMASAGLPASSVVGYELLDGQGLTTSSFTEKVNYQRALEGELARTLMSMDGVESASVRLVLPEERTFSAQTRPASAAVQLVTTKPLTDDQVQAIVHLVASSVPDLSPSAVTVTDSTGRLLAGGPDQQSAAGQKEQVAAEVKLAAAADSMLSSMLGPDKAVVRVSVDLVRDDVTTQSEVFDPEAVVPGATTNSSEEYTSSKSTPSQPPLATPPAAPLNATEQSQYTSSSETTENRVSRTVTEKSSPPGSIRRMSVAVAVDETVSASEATIEQLVGSAVGLDAARGDTIVVAKVAFAQPPAEEPVVPEAPPLTGMLGDMAAPIVGGSLLVLAVLFMLWRLRRSRVPLEPEELAAAGPLPVQAASGVVDIPPSQAPAGMRAARSEADRLLEQIEGSPQEAASVLRGWLAEDAARKA